jgi:hypothetical protein
MPILIDGNDIEQPAILLHFFADWPVSAEDFGFPLPVRRSDRPRFPDTQKK